MREGFDGVMHLTLWQWLLLALGAFGVGLSKTGLAGVSILSVSVFANILPAKQSTGIVLPILIFADLVAVGSFRKHANWKHLYRLFPWAALGVVLGFLALHHVNDAQVSLLIGVIVLVLVAVQALRARKPSAATEEGDVPHNALFAASMGVLAGFTTMVANAAGPVMVLYLLASRLNKMEFIGTSAWFFFVLNLFKVPFSVSLGLITAKSLPLDVILGPCAALGALCGRSILRYINQKLFERLALAFTALAAARLVWEGVVKTFTLVA